MTAQTPMPEPTPRQAALYECAKQAYSLGESMLRSFSGADQADSEAYFCARRVYVAVAQGEEIESAIAREDVRWRAYAAEQERKVNAAPKIRGRGGSAGLSVISHRWVDPEKFAGMAIHIRAMVKIADERAKFHPYQIELANKIERGRAVGNEWIVTRRPIGFSGIVAGPFDTREEAAAWIETQPKEEK